MRAGSAFVGRKHEIQRLRDGLEEARSGRGRVFLVTGEPGIGKTRLADEFARDARSRGARVAWGRWLEQGGTPPFWAWIQVIRDQLRQMQPSQVAAAFGSGISDIARLVPDISEFLPGEEMGPTRPHPDHLPALGTSEPGADHFRLFNGMNRFLSNLAAQRPTVIVLDDAHAADVDSLLFTRFIASEIRRARIVLVVTFRETELRFMPRVGEILGQIARDAETLTIRGLREADVEELIESASGQKPSRLVLASLLRVTEGNPLFLTEIIRLLIAEAKVDWTGGTLGAFELPNGVRLAIRRRIDLLPDIAQKLLSLASVFGGEFQIAVLSALAELDPRQTFESLDAALAWGLVTQSPGAIARYRFSHALIGETLYQELSNSARRLLHHRVAEILDASHQARGEVAEGLAEIAKHYMRALPLGSAEKAVDYAARAAAAAKQSLGYDEASSLYQQALDALELSEPTNQHKRCELLLDLGETQYRAGDFAQSRASFRQAATIARELGGAQAFGRAALGMAMKRTDWGVVDPDIIALLEGALELVGDEESTLRAMLMARLAFELFWSNQNERRAVLAQQAVEVARRAGDRFVVMQALYAKYLSQWGVDTPVEDRLTASTELAELAHEYRFSGSEWVLRAKYLRIADLLELGDITNLDSEIESYSRVADEIGLSRFAYVQVARAMRALMEGRFETAEKLTTESFENGLRDAIAQQMRTDLIFMLRREQSDLAPMEPLFTSAAARNPALIFYRCVLALCYIERDARAEAAAEFELLAARDFASVWRGPGWLASMTLLAEVCSFLNDEVRAGLLYQLLLPHSSHLAAAGIHFCFGATAQYLGMLATTMSRFGEAQSHFEAALRKNQQIGARPWIARTACEYASMLLKRNVSGDQSRAIELIEQARDAAHLLGMRRAR